MGIGRLFILSRQGSNEGPLLGMRRRTSGRMVRVDGFAGGELRLVSRVGPVGRERRVERRQDELARQLLHVHFDAVDARARVGRFDFAREIHRGRVGRRAGRRLDAFRVRLKAGIRKNK